MAVDVCILARILEEWARLFHFSKLSNWETDISSVCKEDEVYI